MTFKNMKFIVESTQHSEQIQKALFSKGYIWERSGDSKMRNTHGSYLYTDIYGNIDYGMSFEDFSAIAKEETCYINSMGEIDWFHGEPDEENISSNIPILKETNPKDAIGSSKLPLNLVPDSLLIYASTAFAEGGSKYSAYNWRVAGVRASVYKAAHDRHMSKWWNGEDCDQATGVKHLASAIACLGIILDAELLDKLNDDRPPYAPVATLMEDCEKVVKHVREMHKDCMLKEYRLADYPKKA